MREEGRIGFYVQRGFSKKEEYEREGYMRNVLEGSILESQRIIKEK